MLSNDLKVRVQYMAKSHLFADLCAWFTSELNGAVSDLLVVVDPSKVYRAQGRAEALTNLIATLEELKRKEEDDAPVENVVIPTPLGPLPSQ